MLIEPVYGWWWKVQAKISDNNTELPVKWTYFSINKFISYQ